MPVNDTITSTDLLIATAGLTVTSARWNAHAAIYRGHLLPVDASVSAAADAVYDLGSSSYRWRNLYLSGYAHESVQTGITATAGGGQGSAAALTKQNSVITVCATDDDSVKLPTATSGNFVRVINYQNTKRLAVYPLSGESINGVTNTSYAVQSRKFMEFFCHTAGAWLPLGSQGVLTAISSETTFTSDASWMHPAGNSIQLNPGNYLFIVGGRIQRVASATPGILGMNVALATTSTGNSLNSSEILIRNSAYGEGVIWNLANGFEQTNIDRWDFGGVAYASVYSTTTLYGILFLDLSTSASITKFGGGVRLTAIRTPNDI